MSTVNTAHSSHLRSIRWEHIPHEELTLEINSRVSRREAFDAYLDVAQEYLRQRMDHLVLEEHDDYINCVAVNLKREMRICRDVYRDYLGALNKKSPTAKARLALDFAVAPMASRRLKEEIIAYVRHVGVSDGMFATLFWNFFGRKDLYRKLSPESLKIETICRGLFSDRCFQSLKEATPRELESLADGPFGNPAEPFERLVIPMGSSPAKYLPNPIWDYCNTLVAYQLWRLWEMVLREICDQHAMIDCEELSDLALTLMRLDPFERLAGRMFFEASATGGTRVTDQLFVSMAQQLDAEHIPLDRNLEAKGREILKNLARRGMGVPTWEVAIADRHEHSFVPQKTATRAEAIVPKDFGTLSRCVKRAFYRAKETYSQALDAVYEQRMPIKENPFAKGLAKRQ